MTGGPLFHTCTVDPARTAAECAAYLAMHGATAVGMSYDGKGTPTGITFRIAAGRLGSQAYTLPVNVAGVQQALLRAYRERKIDRRYAGPDQARRTAWRQVKAWLEAQVAMIEAGAFTLDEVMLPWMRLPDSGMTVYEQARAGYELEAGNG